MPKALVEVGPKPILWHIMKIYEAQGFNDFVLCLGFKGAAIKEYFLLHGDALGGELQLDREAPDAQKVGKDFPARFVITFADTGLDTPTGGRVKRASRFLDGGRFMVTYGDGVADIDIKALLAFHKKQGTIGTVTVVKPPSQFGEVVIGKGERVTEFREKPISDKWVNGGFFVFEPAFLSYVGEADVLERAPLERLAAEGQLSAFRHTGFWQCMDTFKDATLLNDLWAGGAPWKIW
jgi:glucose-1-phosphate cytidylyltransferase